MQSLRYGLGDYECHGCAANFALKCLYSSNHRNVQIFGRYFLKFQVAQTPSPVGRGDHPTSKFPLLLRKLSKHKKKITL